ncbi:MAG: spermine synthase [Puniceicoccaceae bacterium]|nr:MAG: spermine synthase [Puniceicoccaceae bacterium]
MNTRNSASELELGERGCERLAGLAEPRILIGGLGLGFTLRAVLESVGPDARVIVAELMPAVIEWNRRFLENVNGRLLEDPRVEVRCEDVFATLAALGAEACDAIVLDIDNGPTPMVQQTNRRLYGRSGLGLLKDALKATGRLAIWSAARDGAFENRLERAGFRLQVVPAKAYPGAKRPSCTLYLADMAGA